MTSGIKTSCKHKRELYLICRDSNDPKLKRHYKLYCKILSKVILEAKRSNYKHQILRSNSKIKTTLEIVKTVSGKNINKNNIRDIQEINVEGNSTENRQIIASVFNEYFLSVVEKILPLDKNINPNNNACICDIMNHSKTIISNPAHYLAHAFNYPFPNIQLSFSTTKEIEYIIKYLKPTNTCGYDEISTK